MFGNPDVCPTSRCVTRPPSLVSDAAWVERCEVYLRPGSRPPKFLRTELTMACEKWADSRPTNRVCKAIVGELMNADPRPLAWICFGRCLFPQRTDAPLTPLGASRHSR